MISSNAADMARIHALCRFSSPETAPLVYTVGSTTYHGIPTEFSPRTEFRLIDSRVREHVITATMPEGLTIKAVCTEYTDFPCVEWAMYFSNQTDKDSSVISNWCVSPRFRSDSATLIHGNGDTVNEEGYSWKTTPLSDTPTVISPVRDGTPCNGAFPYMRLMFDGWGISIAVGWSGTWQASFVRAGTETVAAFKQADFCSYLKPGETVRTPRMTFLAFDGDNTHASNLWRAFYFAHICPVENGQPLRPLLVLHTWMIDGLPEFCGTTEQNQLTAIDTYEQQGLHPDIWWIDAGWYPCANDWPRTGTWYPNPEHFPNGLGPIGEKCDENGTRLLVWFEPERVNSHSDLWRDHPEWLLRHYEEGSDWYDNTALLNYANPQAVDWVIDTLDRLIKDSHIRIYRQDFNIAPGVFWDSNTEPGRSGILENLHTLGYYRVWDTLLERNPGLWIDSCASGGRRNDIETMRRAVPLHYTDIGYGHHPIKQLQHRQMFEWIPYFRAHTFNWDKPDGTYGGSRPVDEFAFQNAFAPSMTCMVEWNDTPERFAIARQMIPIWRRAANLELSGDFYPLTVCRKSPDDWYAIQFDDQTSKEGFIQIIRNVGVTQDSVTVFPQVDTTATYLFSDYVGKRSFRISGSELARQGFNDTVPPRSGVVWFYTRQ